MTKIDDKYFEKRLNRLLKDIKLGRYSNRKIMKLHLQQVALHTVHRCLTLISDFESSAAKAIRAEFLYPEQETKTEFDRRYSDVAEGDF